MATYTYQITLDGKPLNLNNGNQLLYTDESGLFNGFTLDCIGNMIRVIANRSDGQSTVINILYLNTPSLNCESIQDKLNVIVLTDSSSQGNNANYHFCIQCLGVNGIMNFSYDIPIDDPENFYLFGTLGEHGSNISIANDTFIWQESSSDPYNTQTFQIPEGCLDTPIFNDTSEGDCAAAIVEVNDPPPPPAPCPCFCKYPQSFDTPRGNLKVGDFGSFVDVECTGGCGGKCKLRQVVVGINEQLGVAIWTYSADLEGTFKGCCEGTTTSDPCGTATWCWNEPMKCIAFAVCANAQVGCEECKGDLNIFIKKIPLSIYNKLTGKSDNLNSTIWVNNGGSLAYYFAQGTAAPDDPDATSELGEYITTIDLPDGCCGDRALHVEAVECECDADPVADCGITELTPNPAATTCKPGVDCLVLPCRGCDNPYCEEHDPPDPTTPDNRPWGVGCVNRQCVIIRGGPFPDGPTCGAAGCFFNPEDENPEWDPPLPPPFDPPLPPEDPPVELQIVCQNGKCISIPADEQLFDESGNPLPTGAGYETLDACKQTCELYQKGSYVCIQSDDGSSSCTLVEFEDPLIGYQSLSECEDFCLVTTTEAPTTTTSIPTTTTLVPTTTATPTTTTETPVTSTTSSPPSATCPQGYESCGSGGNWRVNSDCEYDQIFINTTFPECEGDCISYPPGGSDNECIPDSIKEGICCRPTTTTESPTSTTTSAPCNDPAGWSETYNELLSCYSCIYYECLPGGGYATEESCIQNLVDSNVAICETTPQPPPG